MSKLLKLKKWLTIPEAAERLSTILEDKVAEADVLQLGLNNHLKLSVLFVDSPFSILKDQHFLPGIDPYDDRLVGADFSVLDHIVDLCADKNSTRECIFREYLRLIDGPWPEVISWRGIVVNSDDGFPYGGWLPCGSGPIPFILVEESERGEYWNHIRSERYDRMTTLPETAMFIVRTRALLEFEQRLADQEDEEEQKPVEDADKKMAALFDSVRVDDLERLFPTGNWKAWTNNAKRYPALHIARTAPAQWNPYLAAQFLKKKIPSWKEERIIAALKKALPERSEDKEWMLDP